MNPPSIRKGNADLVPYFHPIVLSDGRVPCDVCDAAIVKGVAEQNAATWTRAVCDHCAEALAAANPEWSAGVGMHNG